MGNDKWRASALCLSRWLSVTYAVERANPVIIKFVFALVGLKDTERDCATIWRNK